MNGFDDQIQPDLDAYIVGLGDSPEDYSQDEKGQIFALAKEINKKVKEFANILIGPEADVIFGKRNNRVDAYEYLIRRFKNDRFDLSDEEFDARIYDFRRSITNNLGEINYIRKSAWRKKMGYVLYSTNVDEIFKVGCELWLAEKLFFNFCNLVLDDIDSRKINREQ